MLISQNILFKEISLLRTKLKLL